MGCCGDDYRADGCLARSIHGILDLVTTLAVVAVILINFFYMTQPFAEPPTCYLDSFNGYGDLFVCISIYVVAGVSFLILVGTNILHCCTCCFDVLTFFVEAVGEGAQAALWLCAALEWNKYAAPSVADPNATLEWETQYYDLENLRSIVLGLAYLIAACQLTQAAIATYRFIAACFCGKDDGSKLGNKV